MSSSFTRSIYYSLKPVLPWRLRMAGRRMAARRIRRAFACTWPIDEAAGRTPEGWPGWPEGKQFAFVITHDVEGPEGLAKVRQLAELEMELGFRSSFNFVPEGDYRVPPDLRSWLTERGFEVGVHDLHHDGKLYKSRDHFRSSAGKINGYLKEWGAVGYRSGFMLHNYDWHHDLEIGYDATSFDTDPFEPQADGVGTLFPFWVPAPAAGASTGKGQEASGKGTDCCCAERKEEKGKVADPSPFPLTPCRAIPHSRAGYVELPYTLPQDSTLFFVLGEKTPEIWLRKLDWIASKGGMALVNVHPDYLRFPGEPAGRRTFQVEHYASLLRVTKTRHARAHWNARPIEVANWYRSTVMPQQPAPIHTLPRPRSLQGKRAAVLLYSYYPADPRPRRAAEALVEAGMEVDLFCLRERESDPRREIVRGVNVFRVPLRKRKETKFTYIWRYSVFVLGCAARLALRLPYRRYDVVHTHNMPDFIAFGALPAKLNGAKVILDLHDPMPELMTSIYGFAPRHWLVRVLTRVERWSIRFANLAITPNIAFKKIFVSRGCPPDKMQIVMNSPQPEIFDPGRFGLDADVAPPGDAFRIMHHGSIVHRHGIDLLVEAIARVRPQIPGVSLEIFGSSSPFLETVLDTARKLGVADRVHYHGAKAQTEIADEIRRSHLGVVPNRRSTFTETNFPTRLFEYLAMHRPVIAPATPGIRDYFGDDEMIYFEPGDVADLAAKILWVREHPDEVRPIIHRGVGIYRRHLWAEEKGRFLSRLSSLLNP